jgi:hypothetical protein
MDILYKYAEDNNGNIIHISNTLLEENYYCPECKEKFILKKGNIRQHHFAHNNFFSNCTGEGYLHKTFKKMLLELIKDHINKKLSLELYWNCNICNKEHNGNLVNGIKDAKDEYNLESCRPDIALINEAGIVPIIIEIVYKHEPENNVIEYCKKNKTVLIRIKLDSLDDLENVNSKIKSPTNVVFFDNMNCINYQNYLIQRQLSANSRPIYNRTVQGGQRIDQVEAAYERKKKQQFAIKNYYRNKPKRK